MARARNIKPGFFDNEILGALPALTRLLFIGLWCLADCEGRLQDRPGRIRKELLGYDDVTADDVDVMLQQLDDNGFIQRYEIAGEHYIQVTNFLKHQNPHCKEQASVIPAPGEDMGLGVVAGIHVKGRTGTAGNSQDLRTYQTEKEQENTKAPYMHGASTVQAQEKHQKCPADSLIPDSLIPDSKKHMVVAEQPTAPAPESRNASNIGGGEEKRPGKGQQSPCWKTAKTPLEKSFCRFWDAFPEVRKRAKPACWRKWKTIKPDETMVEHILYAIEAEKQSSDWKRGYVPMPLTWLNQGRWEDISEEESINGHDRNDSNATGGYAGGFHTDGDY